MMKRMFGRFVSAAHHAAIGMNRKTRIRRFISSFIAARERKESDRAPQRLWEEPRMDANGRELSAALFDSLIRVHSRSSFSCLIIRFVRWPVINPATAKLELRPQVHAQAGAWARGHQRAWRRGSHPGG